MPLNYPKDILLSIDIIIVCSMLSCKMKNYPNLEKCLKEPTTTYMGRETYKVKLKNMYLLPSKVDTFTLH